MCSGSSNIPTASVFFEGAERVGALVGFQTTELEWQPARDDERSALPPPDRWQSRRRLWPGSASSRYLNGERRLPANVPRATINGDLLREAPQGSMWAAHRDQAGVLTGWEARGPQYRALHPEEPRFFSVSVRTALRAWPSRKPRLMP
ncbi:DUF3991 domain-containing protein [Rhizobium phaseoli]|uniref:DUF3991 domain-containing protein n=1 Tax=Rhizobium phaseoli TaxID=396 RepID=UPI003AACB0D2